MYKICIYILYINTYSFSSKICCSENIKLVRNKGYIFDD